MPRHWSDQRPLLERQHARLEAQLAALIAQHQAAGLDRAAEQRLACRSLLRALRLHLRLEERWLQAHGLLCPGHRAGHRAALEAAAAQWQSHGAECAGRLALLQSLQAWFLQHLQGPDAIAYGLADGLAAAAVAPQQPLVPSPLTPGPVAAARCARQTLAAQGAALA